MTPYIAPASLPRILIGGRALVALGSSRNTLDTDYLVNDAAQKDMFLGDAAANVDYLNANGNRFFSEIWKLEQGQQIASAQSLLELKAYAFVQHCQNFNWAKVNDCEYDMRFLCLKFNLSAVKTVKKYVSAGELSEINKVLASARR